MKNGISVILPAYLEEENLKILLPKLNNCLKDIDYEIIVIDTQQPQDNTKQVCNENKCLYISRTGGNNYGDAIRTGISNAHKDYTVIMDADGSHDPENIITFYNEMRSEKYDLIIGSRYCKGGDTENPFILKLMSRILNLTYKIIFRLPVDDVSDSFRMYKTCQIKDLTLQCQNFDIVEEILILLNIYHKPLSVKEVPIIFSERAYGKSKRDLVRFIFSYLKTMHTLLKIQISHKSK